MLNIYFEEKDFYSLAAAFDGEYVSDVSLSAEVIFTDEEEIRKLNAETRSVDAVTDVLSFPALDGIKGKKIKKSNFPYDADDEGGLFIGSIAVCVKRAKEQAEEYGHGYDRELYYLVAHGILHLLGYDHMVEEDKLEMRLKEEKVLKKLNLTRDN